YGLYLADAYGDREAVVLANEDVSRSRSGLSGPVNYVFGSAPQIRHLLFRSTYSDLSNLDRGETHAYGNSLAVFSADADTLIQLEVTTDGCHLPQNSWAITNQRRPFYRGRHVTIFNEISLAGRKHEFPARDIDLAAAELNGIQALFHRPYDVLRSALAGHHEGVGHSRQRNVIVALTPAVSGQ